MGRVTVFPVPTTAPVPSALELIRGIWGADPESFSRQNNPLAPSVGTKRQGEFSIECQAAPVRIDLILTKAFDDNPGTSLPFLSDTAQLDVELKRIIAKLEETSLIPAATRLAVAMSFGSAAASEEEGNGIINGVLPEGTKIDFRGAEDFSFQLNKPIKMQDAPGHTLNCITKWAVEKFQIFTMHVPIGGSMPGNFGPVPASEQTPMATVMYDINNRPETRKLDPREQSILLLEQFKIAEIERRKLGINQGQ